MAGGPGRQALHCSVAGEGDIEKDWFVVGATVDVVQDFNIGDWEAMGQNEVKGMSKLVGGAMYMLSKIKGVDEVNEVVYKRFRGAADMDIEVP